MSIPRLSLTAQEAAKSTGLSQDRIKVAIRAGHLRAKRSGKDKDGNPAGRYVIRLADLDAWLEALEDA